MGARLLGGPTPIFIMIRTLRNSGLGQLFLGAIVVAIILAFIFTGAQPGAAGAADECAVNVGKACISPKDFQASLRLLTSIGLNDSAAKKLRLREQVGRGLAERHVLLEEAKRLGLGTSEEDIDAEILEGRTRVSLPADGAERLAMSLAMCVDGPSGCAPGTIGLRAIRVQQNGKFDYELYQRTVRVVTGRSPNHFKEMQQQEYTAERLRNLIRSQVRVSPEEAYLAYSRARSKATGRTAEVKKSWFERYVTAPTEDDIKAFSEKNKEDLEKAIKETAEKWKVGCPVVSEIRLNSADPTSDEAKEVKKAAEELQLKAKLGGSFDELARKKSEGESAALGGRLGCLDAGYGAGAAALIDAADALDRNGAVSKVVESIRGFHVLKLVDKVTDENKEQLVRDFVAYKMTAAALAEEAAKTFAKTLIERASKGEVLAEATESLVEETLKETPFAGDDSEAKKDDHRPKSDITRAVTIEQNPIPEAVAEETPAVALFELEKEGDTIKEPIKTRDGFAVLQLKSKEMLTREKFEEERPEVMATLQKRKAEQALSAYIEKLLEKAGPVSLNPKYIPPAGEDGDKKEKDS